MLFIENLVLLCYVDTNIPEDWPIWPHGVTHPVRIHTYI